MCTACGRRVEEGIRREDKAEDGMKELYGQIVSRTVLVLDPPRGCILAVFLLIWDTFAVRTVQQTERSGYAHAYSG